MTADEWRQRERAARELEGERRIRLPKTNSTERVQLDVFLALDGVWLEAGQITDEGAKQLRDWLIEKFPLDFQKAPSGMGMGSIKAAEGMWLQQKGGPPA